MSKSKIKKWFPEFIDDEQLIQGINPLDSFAKKNNISIPSTTEQYKLSEEEKDNIPEWYTGSINDKGSVIKDEKTGLIVWTHSYWYSGIELSRTAQVCAKNSVRLISKLFNN